MNSRRGNISIVLLVIGLFLVAVAQLAMVCVQRNVQLMEEYWRGRQLRMLCSSVMEALADKDLQDEPTSLEVQLHPGKITALVTATTTLSADNSFRYLDIKAQASNLAYSMRNVKFQLAPKALQLARQYMLISGKEVLGTEYLSGEGIYTSKEEVTVPQIDFLKNTSTAKKSISALAMEDVRLYGLDRRFYYLPTAGNILTFTKNLKVYGTAVVASEGSIIIEEGCQFSDRVIFLSKGNITIKNDVDLPKALLIAYGKVSVGADCKFGGVIFSGSNIEILGSSQLIHDAEVVAPFVSTCYIL